MRITSWPLFANQDFMGSSGTRARGARTEPDIALRPLRKHRVQTA